MPPVSGRCGAWLFTAALLPVSLLLASCSTEDSSSSNAPAAVPAASGNQPANGPAAGAATSMASVFESPRKADGPVNIRIVTNGISPFWDPMKVGMKKAAGELEGCQAEWAGPANALI